MNNNAGVLIGAVGVLAYISPVVHLLAVTVCFASLSALLSVIAHIELRRRGGKNIEISAKAATGALYNVLVGVVVVFLSWVLGDYVLYMPDIGLGKIATGIICVVEMMSILRIATILTGKKSYGNLSKFIKSKFQK